VTYLPWLPCHARLVQSQPVPPRSSKLIVNIYAFVYGLGLPPWYHRFLYLDLLKHVIRNLSRFYLRGRTLAVESSISRGRNGHSVATGCDKCSCAGVPNEMHALFHCQDLFVCCLRKKKERISLCQQSHPCLRELRKRKRKDYANKVTPACVN